MDELTSKLLPRVPENCQWMLITNPNIKDKIKQFKLNIPRMKKILKFYIETNIEYKNA